MERVLFPRRASRPKLLSQYLFLLRVRHICCRCSRWGLLGRGGTLALRNPGRAKQASKPDTYLHRRCASPLLLVTQEPRHLCTIMSVCVAAPSRVSTTPAS